MPGKYILVNTEADNLRELRNRLDRVGLESPFLDLRLRHSELSMDMNYIEMLRPYSRIYHSMLPTQASGRWSVKNPPLTNFKEDLRDCLLPDEGDAWIAWDLDAIEGKIVAAYSHDRLDLDAFDKGWDIHTITACKMVGIPLPPDLRDPHQSDLAFGWRQQHGWKGKEDKRRILAKVRYCLLYGRDHTAVSGSKYEKDMVKMGFDRSVLVQAATQFLASKPNLRSTKAKWWAHCAKVGEARTIFGRRRKLFGKQWDKSKEGWNHMIQGSVTDMVNTALIEIHQANPSWRLIYPSHDAAKHRVPLEALSPANRQATLDIFKRAVLKTYDIEGERIESTATFHIYYDDGRVEHL